MRGFEKPKNARKVIGRLMGYLLQSKWMLLLVVVLMLISSASSLAGSYFLKPFINDYIIPGNFTGLATALLGLAGLYLLGVVAMFSQSWIMLRIAQHTVNRLRRDLFDKMQSLPLKYFDTHTHGELMSRYTNDVDNVQMALEQSVVQLMSSVLIFVGAVAMMISLSPVLFIVTALVFVLMFFMIQRITKRSSVYYKEQQKYLGEVNGYIEELVDGLKVVKVFNHEKTAINEFKVRNEKYRQSATQANFYAAVVMPVTNNLNNVSYAATALVGGILTVSGLFDIGSLAAFLQLSRQVGQPITMMTNQLNTVLAALAGAERVFEMMDEQPEVDDGTVTLVGVNKKEDGTFEVYSNGTHPSHWAWKVPQADGSVQYVELKGDVRFNDVIFGYDPLKTVLNSISLYAKPGQKIAFVGSTGAGKTTITNLINRFYDINDGAITYDGIDVKQICKNNLRESLGMVLQDTHLFTGTVMDNIRYGRLDASDEECIKAAKQVNAHSFIKRLPQGYQTLLTADGNNLSQGQRQLLAIARAAVADPPVMILDEATSSIDTRTERLIEKGMDALMKDRTVFVIAHRLSTVRNSNAIMVLENGEIIERGDHNDLLQQQGRYYRLYTGQFELN
ncbi:MAG: ABC transporter ATP-binding protein/permease [Anaerolineae bacterium]|nr:ABC transporter ATP-binding protein/permease [Anaerolineae bacterium]